MMTQYIIKSSLEVGLCQLYSCNQCLIIFYNKVAQDTTTQNYLCFVSYYIVFKGLVEKSHIHCKTKNSVQQYTASAASSSDGMGEEERKLGAKHAVCGGLELKAA